jgi:YbbR domain-containing protein
MPSFRRNLAYKFISLAVAVLLYVVAYAQRNPRITQDVYVQPVVEGVPAHLGVSEPPKPYYLKVSGPEPSVTALVRAGIRGKVDASRAAPGVAKLQVQYDLPPGVDATGARVVSLVLGPLTSKRVPVRVSFDRQTAPPGKIYGEPVVRPAEVKVVGLADDINRVAQVVAVLEPGTTGAAEGGAIDEPGVDVAAQDAAGQVVQNVSLRPGKVRVAVGLIDQPARRNLLVNVRRIGEAAPGFQVVDFRAVPEEIPVEGPQQRLKGLYSLTVGVDVAGLKADTVRTLTVTPPRGVRIAGPAEVRVTVLVRPNAPPAGGGALPPGGGEIAAPPDNTPPPAAGGNKEP